VAWHYYDYHRARILDIFNEESTVKEAVFEAARRTYWMP
jgi:hypothetical protein